MAPITRICRLSAAVAASLSLMMPQAASALVDERLDRYVQAWVSSVNADDAAAAAQYALLVDKEPDNAALANSLWRSAIRSGDQKKALRAARLLQLRGDQGEALLLLFADEIQRRDWAGAQSGINSISASSPYAFLEPLLAAWLRVGQGKAHGFPLQPRNQLLRFYAVDQRAYLNLALGDWAAAKISLAAFAEIDTDYARNLRIRAAPVLAKRGDRAFAASIIEGLMPADIAEAHIGNIRPARLSKIDAADGISALFTRLAEALIDQNLPDKALMMARFADWLAPHNDAAKLALARALKSEMLLDGADRQLGDIAAFSPYWSRANINRIQDHLRANENQAALQLARNAAATRKTPEMQILLAQAQQANGDLSAAESNFSALLDGGVAARATPARRAVYHLYLATVLEEQGRWAEARDLLENGIKLDPNNPYLINFLGYTLLERNEDIEAALDMLKRAHRLAPESNAITDSLGWGYFLTGDYPRAVRYLEKAARGPLDDFVIQEHLGDAYWLSGRFIDARYAWRTAALVADDADKSRLAMKIDLGLDRAARKN